MQALIGVESGVVDVARSIAALKKERAAREDQRTQSRGLRWKNSHMKPHPSRLKSEGLGDNFTARMSSCMRGIAALSSPEDTAYSAPPAGPDGGR